MNFFAKFKIKNEIKIFGGLDFVRFLGGIHTRKYPEGTRNQIWCSKTGTGSEPVICYLVPVTASATPIEFIVFFLVVHD